MITQEQKKALQDKGYAVEDMGAEWGADFAGQYRWTLGDDAGVPQFSEADAWEDAAQYDPQLVAYETANA